MRNDTSGNNLSVDELIRLGTELVTGCEVLDSPYDRSHSLQELLDQYIEWKEKVRILLEASPVGRRVVFQLHQVQKAFDGTSFDFAKKKLIVNNSNGVILANEISKRVKEISLILDRVQLVDSPSDEPALDKKVIEFRHDPCSLRCAATDEEQTFLKDTQKACILIKAAFDEANPPGEWIGVLSDGVEDSMEGRQLYDAGRTINQAFRKAFKINSDLFLLDFANKQVKLNLDAPQFRLSQK